MGWSEAEVVCMKHPNHKQQPGVCSCCLREKLSKLSVPINFVVPSSNQLYSPSDSSSPTNYCYYSSGHSSSTHMSPSSSGWRGHHHRIASDVVNYFSFVSGSSRIGGLKKSRSIAFVTPRGGGIVGDGVNDRNSKTKKEGLWSKFIKSTSKKTKHVFVHPRIKQMYT